MPNTDPTQGHSGAFRLFRVAGISVYLHWSWLLVAYLELQWRANSYSTQTWNAAEYLTLFGIVLLHEFGHALACRQVGGEADRIVLWPLGGIAYVNPPPRPGAMLWSIAAGPLVNVVLLPITIGAAVIAGSAGLAALSPDARRYLDAVAILNASLLVFNMLPVYPLDGGQILQALLWFVIGRARSLLVVSIIGMVAGAACIVLALVQGDLWFAILAAFVGMRAWAGFQAARLLSRLAALPRHLEAKCPGCGGHPLAGNFWRCANCQAQFDTFSTRAVCPGCRATFADTRCMECGNARPIAEWFTGLAGARAAQTAAIAGPDGA